MGWERNKLSTNIFKDSRESLGKVMIGSVLMLLRAIHVEKGSGAWSAMGEIMGHLLFNEVASISILMGIQRCRDCLEHMTKFCLWIFNWIIYII